jgi:hypothetical protein
MDYDELRELSQELGRPIETLYALDGYNDPIYIGPTRVVGAEWFAGHWHRLNIPVGWHYRRIHYVLISQSPRLPFWKSFTVGKGALKQVYSATDGYLNTDGHWRELNNACRDAVYLGLVPLDAYVDRRNPNPISYLAQPVEAELAAIQSPEAYLFPARFPMPLVPHFGELHPGVIPQPYHIELWAEKSTMNDILIPLAARYRLNLITGVGELSATACRNLINRAIQSGRPVRILYISDFDPAGRIMPVSVARKIEFELDRQGLDLDIQVRPIVLSYAQCVQYRLPRTPIKPKDKRRTGFEQRFGEGATELDALEALHPGVLTRILTQEIEHYWNPEHDGSVEAQIAVYKEELDRIEESVRNQHSNELDGFTIEVGHLNVQLQAVNQQAAALRERMQPLWQAMVGELEEDQPEPNFECPEFDYVDEDANPLFDSTRDYVEQMDSYKAFQDKPTERRPRRPRQPRPARAPQTGFTRGN